MSIVGPGLLLVSAWHQNTRSVEAENAANEKEMVFQTVRKYEEIPMTFYLGGTQGTRLHELSNCLSPNYVKITLKIDIIVTKFKSRKKNRNEKFY